jgi:hypothetical protein
MIGAEMLISILFMYVCVMALTPFFAFAMYLMHSGDVVRDRDAAARFTAQLKASSIEEGWAVSARPMLEPAARDEQDAPVAV